MTAGQVSLFEVLIGGMNKLTDDQILQANPPVVPAGMISLRCLTRSIRFEYLAVAARQRTILVVSALGFSKSAWSKCRLSFSLRTISFGSHDGDTSDSTTLPGRASDLSSLSKEIERVEIFVTIKIVSFIEKKKVQVELFIKASLGKQKIIFI